MFLMCAQIESCHVLQVKTPEKEGYLALQIGAVDRRLKRAGRAEVCVCCERVCTRTLVCSLQQEQSFLSKTLNPPFAVIDLAFHAKTCIP